uniref:Uncharacterized protein n=1 Tax=Physcomitrium patens TaxID=3218 RepID=A0A2K1J4E8_PHYPA|nr:hypothetical protein PHYPA_022255 [Physcomitrium patens]
MRLQATQKPNICLFADTSCACGSTSLAPASYQPEQTQRKCGSNRIKGELRQGQNDNTKNGKNNPRNTTSMNPKT